MTFTLKGHFKNTQKRPTEGLLLPADSMSEHIDTAYHSNHHIELYFASRTLEVWVHLYVKDRNASVLFHKKQPVPLEDLKESDRQDAIQIDTFTL